MKILVTYRVKDVDWWLTYNTLEKIGNAYGIYFEIFRRKNSNLVGYIAEFQDAERLDEILLNITSLSDSFRINDVIVKTIEMLELVNKSRENYL